MKKNLIIYNGIARYVSLRDGVAQLKIEITDKTVMVYDGREVTNPKSCMMNALLELPLFGKELTVPLAREISQLKIGHRIRLTMTEYTGGRRSYDICNISMCKCL